MGWLAKFAIGATLKRAGGSIAGFWNGISPKAKLWIVIALFVAIGSVVHHIVAHHQLTARYHQGETDGYQRALRDVKAAQDKARQAALAYRHKTETKDTASVQKARNDYAKDLDHIGALDRELRNGPPPRIYPVGRGQGSVPGASAPAGGIDGPGGAVNAELSEIPAGYAVLEWDPLVDHAESCDVDRSKLTRLQQLIAGIYANHAEGTTDAK